MTYNPSMYSYWFGCVYSANSTIALGLSDEKFLMHCYNRLLGVVWVMAHHKTIGYVGTIRTSRVSRISMYKHALLCDPGGSIGMTTL